ncbi:unnamed protein product [Haemonchus placei]|uniref:DUF3719 domain-containing protein n=1 Tax=Haemonchus placei TaxID=6290 RepID=A0A0N4W3Q9_HAEPC|nr:unnamed protein product [Haemonchus placei]
MANGRINRGSPQMDPRVKRISNTLPSRSGRRLTLHLPVESPTRRSSYESEWSQEPHGIFRRRESFPAESRTVSQCTLLGDRHNSVALDGSRRESRDFQDFVRDVRRHSRSSFNRECYLNNSMRRELETRWLDDYIRDYYAVIEQRQKWHDMLYDLQNRRLLHEMLLLPTMEDELSSRRGLGAPSEPRVFHGMETLFEKHEYSRAGRHLRKPFLRRTALSHDAVFLPRSVEKQDDRSMFLRRKFLSTGAVSSRDSTNSTESSAPEAIFGSSVDSAGSDLG